MLPVPIRFAPCVLLILFLYGTLHYSFAIPVVFGSDDLAAIVLMHDSATPISTKIVAIAVWSGGYMLLVAKAAQPNAHKRRSRSTLLVQVAWLVVALALSWFVSIGEAIVKTGQDEITLARLWIDLKGPVSSVATWAAAVIGASALWSEKSDNVRTRWELSSTVLGALLIFLTSIVSIVAYAELWTGYAWSSEGRGSFVASRASSTLFNPNVLGLWATFTTVAVALLYIEKVISKSMMRSLCVLLSLVTLAASSRSAFIPLVISWLILCSSLAIGSPVRLGRTVEAALTWAASLVAIVYATKASVMLGIQGNLVESLTRNSIRLTESFSVAAVYLLSSLSILPDGWTVLPENTQMSMDGRFVRAAARTGAPGADNDYLTILAGAGWEVFSIWIGLWLLVAVRTVAGFWQTRDRAFAYAFVLVFICGMAGLGMRASQVFPVSLFISIALSWALFLVARGESMRNKEVF